MQRALERTVEGTAGPLTKAAVNIHTLSCTACRTRLAQLRATASEAR